jgi:uncharacterized protein with beta-barrel porin domain
MRIFALLSLIVALAGCQSGPNAATRWNDMQIDIALRHQYEKYSCGYRSLAGYSKESNCARAPRRVSKRSPVSQPTRIITSNSSDNTAQAAYNSVQGLSQKIDVLEEALKTNVATTNHNQSLIVDQIIALKKQLAALQGSTPAAEPTPPPSTASASGIKIGN